MLNSLQPGDMVQLIIKAHEFYSDEKIKISPGQKYKVQCSKNQKWTDWYISTDVDGFCNPLAWLAGQRIQSVKCFCLCGAYNDTEDQLFPIGSDNEFSTDDKEGILSFFANDSARHYSNNKGAVIISVKRLQ